MLVNDVGILCVLYIYPILSVRQLGHFHNGLTNLIIVGQANYNEPTCLDRSAHYSSRLK